VRPAGGYVESWEIGIVPGYRDWPALWVDCLAGVTGSAVQDDVMHSLVYRGQGQVMVEELAELHQHQGVARVEVGDVCVHNDGD
jgi:hypothetical protein